MIGIILKVERYS